MIQETKAYKVGEMFFPTIQQAQKQELIALFNGLDDGAGHDNANACADAVLANVDEVVAILTHQPKSKSPRKPRSDIGTKRAKKGETPAVL